MGGPPKAAKASPRPTETTQEIMQAGRKKRQDIAQMQGFRSTLVAGNPDRAGSTLLGGGE